MGRHTCCVVNCKNNGVRSKECKFYKFPAAQYKVEQRKKWIAAVKRKNPDGSPWCPKRWDLICSAHFIGNKKSEEELSPSYIPAIFPPAYKTKVVDQTGATKRYERLMKRRINKQEPITTTKAPERVVEEVMEQPEPDNDSNAGTNQSHHERKTCNQECKVDIFSPHLTQPEKTFICNRYINNTTSCSDVEIQTEIIIPSRIIVPNRKQFKDKACGTPQKVYVSQSVGPDIQNDESTTERRFAGISSIKNNEQCLDLAGVTQEHFQFLLKRIDAADNCQISKENRF